MVILSAKYDVNGLKEKCVDSLHIDDTRVSIISKTVLLGLIRFNIGIFFVNVKFFRGADCRHGKN